MGTYASWGSETLHGRSHLHDPHGHGWHLDRSGFDAFLRGAAESAGAELRRAEAVPPPVPRAPATGAYCSAKAAGSKRCAATGSWTPPVAAP
ncbi:hypothetical protein GCM10011428_56240 [Streptomyces violaceus]|uniref:NAD(P)/FAD-dependent oxidoreductase n=1 Tax=Streptomyces violaceus TaxID=1936 RepID=UPI0031EF0B63